MKNRLVDVFAVILVVVLVGCSAMDSREGAGAVDATDLASGSAAGQSDGGDAEAPVSRGEVLFSSALATGADSTSSVSCAQCHGADGSGGRAANIRGLAATVLRDHAQGDAFHPPLSGGRPNRVPEVKFPELDVADFEAIATFLAGG